MKRQRLRRALAVATALSAVTPLFAEQRARAAIDSALGSCSGRGGICGGVRGVRLGADGLSFDGVWRIAASRVWSAQTVTVSAAWSGVQVDVWGLRHEPARASPSPKSPTPQAPPPQRPPSSGLSGPPKLPNRGIPVSIEVHGPVDLTVADAHVNVRSVALSIDAQGAIEAQGIVTVEGRGHTVTSHGPIRLQPVSVSPAALSFDGSFAVDEATEVLVVSGTVSRARAHLMLGSESSGLAIDFARPHQLHDGESKPTRLQLSAAAFNLAALWPVLQDHALARRLGLSPDITIDGTIEVVMDPDIRAHVRGLQIRGLSLRHGKLARSRLDFDPVLLDGDAWWHSAQTYDAQLTVAHRDITAHAAGSRRGDAVQGSIELGQMPCQDFVDSIPKALADVVHGTQLRGEIDGRVAVSWSLTELERIRGLTETEINPLAPARPGTLGFDFDFLERCSVTDDAAGLDFEGLRGPYRHRFVDGRGRTRERAMAAGPTGFVPLSSVPLIADAFVVLEDTRFFEHDGFDRDQMRNAWWHNLLVGRISRGASTISQQTARNLFLGVDRSLGRKIQEAFITARLEDTLSKRRILELYVNVIELAPGVHGVDDAARFYFGKQASELNVLQSVHLASLAPAPHTYAERFATGEVDHDWMANLRNQARRMHRHRKIDHNDLLRALNTELGLLDRTARSDARE